jgi:hypothetical protein
MKKAVIGIDVSKEKLDFCVKTVCEFVTANTGASIKNFLK